MLSSGSFRSLNAGLFVSTSSLAFAVAQPALAHEAPRTSSVSHAAPIKIARTAPESSPAEQVSQGILNHPGAALDLVLLRQEALGLAPLAMTELTSLAQDALIIGGGAAAAGIIALLLDDDDDPQAPPPPPPSPPSSVVPAQPPAPTPTPTPTPAEAEEGKNAGSDFFERAQILADAGALEWVYFLAEDESDMATLIYPVAVERHNKVVWTELESIVGGYPSDHAGKLSR